MVGLRISGCKVLSLASNELIRAAGYPFLVWTIMSFRALMDYSAQLF